jgi:hypothetical protein
MSGFCCEQPDRKNDVGSTPRCYHCGRSLVEYAEPWLVCGAAGPIIQFHTRCLPAWTRTLNQDIQDVFRHALRGDLAHSMEPPIESTAQESAGYSQRHVDLAQPGYFDLRALSEYSCCSVRWLLDRLVDRVCPLPHHRIGGKILVGKDDFDTWMHHFRSVDGSAAMDAIVDDVLTGLAANKLGRVRTR